MVSEVYSIVPSAPKESSERPSLAVCFLPSISRPCSRQPQDRIRVEQMVMRDGDARWRCEVEMRGGDARWRCEVEMRGTGVIQMDGRDPHEARTRAPMRRTNGGRASALGRPVPAGGVGGSRTRACVYTRTRRDASDASPTGQPLGRTAGSLWQDGLLAPHVRPQDLGDRERAVLVLVVFEDGDERAPDRQPRTIDGVAEDRLLCLALGAVVVQGWVWRGWPADGG